jgi:hypothetical protein
MGILPEALARRARAESGDEDNLAKRVETLETELTALKARVEALEKPTEPGDPEARASGWKAAIAHVTRG